MRVQELMREDVVVCSPNDNLRDVARKLWDHDCGALPVCESDGGRRIVGMITDRDICMHACFEDRPLSQLWARNAMTPEALTCGPDDSLADAERIMREAQVRRLPVQDGSGNLVGFISLADLAEEAGRERGWSRRQIEEAEIGDTLTAICEPHHHGQVGAQA